MTWSREIYTLPLVPFKIPSQNLQLIAIRNPNQEKYFASLIFDIYLSEMIFWAIHWVTLFSLKNKIKYTMDPGMYFLVNINEDYTKKELN